MTVKQLGSDGAGFCPTFFVLWKLCATLATTRCPDESRARRYPYVRSRGAVHPTVTVCLEPPHMKLHGMRNGGSMAFDVGVCGMPDPVGFLALASLTLAARSGGCPLPSCHSPSTPSVTSTAQRCESGRGTGDDACISAANGLGTIPRPTEVGSRGLKFRPTLTHAHRGEEKWQEYLIHPESCIEYRIHVMTPPPLLSWSLLRTIKQTTV